MGQQITLNIGGTGEKTVNADTLQVIDLWHVAEYLDDNEVKFGNGKSAGEAVREVWTLAHNLLRHCQTVD